MNTLSVEDSVFEGNRQIPGGSELVRERRAAVGLVNRVVCFPNKFSPTVNLGMTPDLG